jgi:hypothetical protein
MKSSRNEKISTSHEWLSMFWKSSQYLKILNEEDSDSDFLSDSEDDIDWEERWVYKKSFAFPLGPGYFFLSVYTLRS